MSLRPIVVKRPGGGEMVIRANAVKTVELLHRTPHTMPPSQGGKDQWVVAVNDKETYRGSERVARRQYERLRRYVV